MTDDLWRALGFLAPIGTLINLLLGWLMYRLNRAKSSQADDDRRVERLREELEEERTARQEAERRADRAERLYWELRDRRQGQPRPGRD